MIAGSGNSFIATLVERHKRCVMLAKVGNNGSHSVIQALIKQSRKLPKALYRALTWDRGTEMAGHKKFTLATDIDVFLCKPHSPCQRGTNEKTNRLMRHYIPKGMDFSIHSQAKLSVSMHVLRRPVEAAPNADIGAFLNNGTRALTFLPSVGVTAVALCERGFSRE